MSHYIQERICYRGRFQDFPRKDWKIQEKKVEKLLDNIIDIAQVLKLFNLFRRAAIEDIYPNCTFYFGN